MASRCESCSADPPKKERNRLPDDAVVDVEAEEKEANSDEILERRMKQPRFAQGRSVRNALGAGKGSESDNGDRE